MARPRLGEGESERLQMVITAEELEAIEVWQHENRVPSKSEAIRRLCRIALLVESEFEQIVNLANKFRDDLTDLKNEAIEERETIESPDAKDIQFGQEEMSDVLKASEGRARLTSDGAQELQGLIAALYGVMKIRRGVIESRDERKKLLLNFTVAKNRVATKQVLLRPMAPDGTANAEEFDDLHNRPNPFWRVRDWPSRLRDRAKGKGKSQ